MEDKKNKKNKNKVEDLEIKLDEFLQEEEEEKECVGEECVINDGKEIIERVNKVYKTTDGRQLLI
jgi:low affinity Fe/Cu permease